MGGGGRGGEGRSGLCICCECGGVVREINAQAASKIYQVTGTNIQLEGTQAQIKPH